MHHDGMNELRNLVGQFRRLLPGLAVLEITTAVIFLSLCFLARGMDTGIHVLLLDVYELTGSRISGLISNLGVFLWIAIAAVCVFSASVLPSTDSLGRSWRVFFLCSAGIALMLMLDDYLSIHELAATVAGAVIGFEPSRSAQNAWEMITFGVYGIALLAYGLGFRRLILSTDYFVLMLSCLLLGLSLVADMTLGDRLTNLLGYRSVDGAVEDLLKMLGIVTLASYYFLTARVRIRANLA